MVDLFIFKASCYLACTVFAPGPYLVTDYAVNTETLVFVTVMMEVQVLYDTGPPTC